MKVLKGTFEEQYQTVKDLCEIDQQYILGKANVVQQLIYREHIDGSRRIHLEKGISGAQMLDMDSISLETIIIES